MANWEVTVSMTTCLFTCLIFLGDSLDTNNNTMDNIWNFLIKSSCSLSSSHLCSTFLSSWPYSPNPDYGRWEAQNFQVSPSPTFHQSVLIKLLSFIYLLHELFVCDNRLRKRNCSFCGIYSIFIVSHLSQLDTVSEERQEISEECLPRGRRVHNSATCPNFEETAPILTCYLPCVPESTSNVLFFQVPVDCLNCDSAA